MNFGEMKMKIVLSVDKVFRKIGLLPKDKYRGE